MRPSLRPLREFAIENCRHIKGVLADIDDTLTTDGKLSAAAYTALENLRAAGLIVIPVTGRPAGWCDLIARMWPVDAVVGENGAFWMRHDTKLGRLRTVAIADALVRAQRQAQLDLLADQILTAVPGCAMASDQFCRIADIAIDFCEDVTPLPPSAIDEIVRLMREAGLTAKVSSIHVNGWYGDYDKLSSTRRLLVEEFASDISDAAERERWVFIGDSPNDAPMFSYFPNAVGVANVMTYVDRIAQLPAWVTPSPAGAGFVELAERLLQSRLA